MKRTLARLCFTLCGWVASGAGFADGFDIKDDGRRLELSEAGQPVLTYVYRATEAAPDSKNATATRSSGYFHPVYGLYGEVLTGESPSNWPGPPGIHWNWARLGIGGKVIDLGRENGGRREFERILRKDAAANGAAVSLQNVWLAGSDNRAQVLETTSFTVHSVVKDKRTIDVAILLKSVASEKIFVAGGLPETGFSFVLNPERKDWSFSGGTGLIPAEGKPMLSPFMVCSYRDDRRSSRSGLAIFQDARNPGYSQPSWLVEAPDRLLAGVPDSARAELNPGDFVEFRYRLVLTHLTGAAGELSPEYAAFMAEGQQRE